MGRTDDCLDLRTMQAALERLSEALRDHASSLTRLHQALLSRSRGIPANDA